MHYFRPVNSQPKTGQRISIVEMQLGPLGFASFFSDSDWSAVLVLRRQWRPPPSSSSASSSAPSPTSPSCIVPSLPRTDPLPSPCPPPPSLPFCGRGEHRTRHRSQLHRYLKYPPFRSFLNAYVTRNWLAASCASLSLSLTAWRAPPYGLFAATALKMACSRASTTASSATPPTSRPYLRARGLQASTASL
jgi:hypothetical protein